MQPKQSVVITLDTPITRGEQNIAAVTLMKPLAGALRGVALTDVLQLDVIALSKVLPRISDPVLTTQDVLRLDPADLLQLGTEVAGFWCRTRRRWTPPSIRRRRDGRHRARVPLVARSDGGDVAARADGLARARACTLRTG